MSNFLVAIICFYIDMSLHLKTNIIYTNILIGTFNLIPIMPLDGGKIFKEILKKAIGNKNANIFMSISTKIVLAILTIVYSIAIFKIKNIAIVMVLMYLWYLYYLEDKKLKLMLKAYEVIENTDREGKILNKNIEIKTI